MYRYCIALVLLLMAMGNSPKADFLVISQKQITINGNTSLGKFSCRYQVQDLCDTLSLRTDARKMALLQFSIPVKEFCCGNFLLNKDFQRTLRAKDFPVAEVRVIQLQQINSRQYKGVVQLSVAGKLVVFNNVQFTGIKTNEGNALETRLQLNTTTLELNNPQRLAGLVKVDDMLDIDIRLIL
jgi:hypothetical protein